jgi:hypothetical protein
MTTEGRFFGIEQRESLVECARDLATLFGATNVSFAQGAFDSRNPEDYDAFYFFNPFEEDNFPRKCEFDWPLPSRAERFEENVYGAQQFLRAAKAGTRVVTYNGMGGRLPSCYDLIEREQMGCTLELAVKSGRDR